MESEFPLMSDNTFFMTKMYKFSINNYILPMQINVTCIINYVREKMQHDR